MEPPTTSRNWVAWALGLIVGSLLAAYVISYGLLSLNGAYEPSALGVNRVRAYGWSPYGFMDRRKPRTFRFRTALLYPYLPLFLLDQRYWHLDNEVGRYGRPVHDLDYIDK